MSEVPEEIILARNEAALHLDRIHRIFKPGTKLTLLARSPVSTERDFLLSNDDINLAIRSLEILRDKPGYVVPPDNANKGNK